MAGQQQHVELHRKIGLRKRLLQSLGGKPGAAYVPFLGDGDIAAACYQGWNIFGADIDPARIEIARERLNGATLKVADCDSWPFPEATQSVFRLADFDSYAYPYHSFRAFWAATHKAPRMLLVFTDGNKQTIMRQHRLYLPDGTTTAQQSLTTNEARAAFNFYFGRHVLPWFTEAIIPYRVMDRAFYQRGMMLYWGAVIEC